MQMKIKNILEYFPEAIEKVLAVDVVENYEKFI